MVDLDISDVLTHCSMAEREIRKFDDRMMAVCQRYIDKERDHHAYQNRTHMAETHTNAVRVGKSEVRCEMAVEYASYLQRSKSGGTKHWSHFEDYMKAAQSGVNDVFVTTADKIGKR